MAVLRETAAGQFVTGPRDDERLTAILDCYRPTGIGGGLADFDFTAPARLLSSQADPYVLRARASNARFPVKHTARFDLSAARLPADARRRRLEIFHRQQVQPLEPVETRNCNGI